ncbi:MAG: hypothetical protein CMH61_00430 [Nanoarchaeota archaeon]|nr:hypothetical protein [Nanoarchaeota archaeon]|tara:strand:+ start:135 stop:845 length:711 start_codon:yes stop_codon:yes gene_type:complete
MLDKHVKDELIVRSFLSNADSVRDKGRKIELQEKVGNQYQTVRQTERADIHAAADQARTILSSERDITVLDVGDVSYLGEVIERSGFRTSYENLSRIANQRPADALKVAQGLLDNESALDYFSVDEIDYLDSIMDIVESNKVNTAYGVVHDQAIAGLLGGSIDQPLAHQTVQSGVRTINGPLTDEELASVKPRGLGYMLRSIFHIGELLEGEESAGDAYQTVKDALQNHPQYDGQQ